MPVPPPKVRRRSPSKSLPLYDWRRRFGWPGLAIVAFLLVLGLRDPTARARIGLTMTAAYPIVILKLGLGKVTTGSRNLALAALAIAGAVVIASEVELGQVYFPFKPIAEVTLSDTNPDANINLPSDVQNVEIQTRGHLTPGGRASDGDFRIVMTRDGHDVSVKGTLSRKIGRSPRMLRRGNSSSFVTTHEVERSEVSLPGSGPAKAHLAFASGGLKPEFLVTVLPVPVPNRWALPLFAALAIVSVVVQTIGRRRKLPSRFATAVCIAGAFALYVDNFAEPDDPMVSLMAGSVVAILSGALVAWLMGRIVRRWASPPLAAPPWEIPEQHVPK